MKPIDGLKALAMKPMAPKKAPMPLGAMDDDEDEEMEASPRVERVMPYAEEAVEALKTGNAEGLAKALLSFYDNCHAPEDADDEG